MSLEKILEILLAVLSICEAVNDKVAFVDAKLDELFDDEEGSGPDEPFDEEKQDSDE